MSAKPQWKLVLPFSFAGVMVLGILIGFQLKEKTMAPGFYTGKRGSSLQELSILLGKRYVDSLPQEAAEAMIAQSILSQLDPHSQFLGPADQSLLDESMEGKYGGIGLEYRILFDSVVVTAVRPDGPAAKAGIRVGARILRIADSILLSGPGRSQSDLRTFFRGQPGTAVQLTYWQDNGTRKATIQRKVLSIDPIAAAYLLDKQTGYIKLSIFSDRSYLSFMQALDSLQQKGMKSLVLDLRGNGGGLLKEAVAIADEFISDQKLLVYTEGAHLPRQDFYAQKPGLFETGKLAVLIDGGSASASEVLAGALQDHGRAKLFGQHSYGKGLVQQQFKLSNGSAVKLTVARYFTPKGRNLQSPYGGGQGDSLPAGHPQIVKASMGGLAPDQVLQQDTDKIRDILSNQFIYNNIHEFADYLIQHEKGLVLRFFPAAGADSVSGQAQFLNQSLQRFQAKQIKDQMHSGNWSMASINFLKSLIYRSIQGSTGFYIQYNKEDKTVLSAWTWIKSTN